MIYNSLGNTGLRVSKIAYGSLTMGPLQRNFSAEEGASLIEYAFRLGVNFIDTAELYGTYPHIRHALRMIPRDQLVIATKSYAYSRDTALESVDKARREMNIDYIDIFMLHEQMNVHTIRGHYEAIETLLELKSKGIIKAIGLSTHYISGVKAAIRFPEIELVHPIVNIRGLGIQDGTMQEMIAVLEMYRSLGGGIFGMKPLGGGNLLHSIDECFDFVLKQPYLDSIAFGMQSFDEIDYNIARVMSLQIDNDLVSRVSGHEKKLQIADWCINCGNCVRKCDHRALSLGDEGIQIHRERCVLCGYCASVCPEFCIKVY